MTMGKYDVLRYADILRSGIGTEMVDILVGAEKKLFRLHKTFLCQRIDYFDKMFNGEFVEAAGIANLPEDDPAAFDLLVEWMFNSNPRE